MCICLLVLFFPLFNTNVTLNARHQTEEVARRGSRVAGPHCSGGREAKGRIPSHMLTGRLREGHRASLYRTHTEQQRGARGDRTATPREEQRVGAGIARQAEDASERPGARARRSAQREPEPLRGERRTARRCAAAREDALHARQYVSLLSFSCTRCLCLHVRIFSIYFFRILCAGCGCVCACVVHVCVVFVCVQGISL